MIYYILGGILIALDLVLIIWASVDILKSNRNIGLIFLLLLAPVVGPIIYFQSK